MTPILQETLAATGLVVFLIAAWWLTDILGAILS